MSRIFEILFLLLAGTAAGAGLFELRDYDPPPYADNRAPFVIQLAEQFGQADTLILGDSLVEQTNFAQVCGATFNAGIGGARVQDVRAALPQLLSATQPRRVVVAVGANHFAAGEEFGTFRHQYPLLLDELGAQELVLVGVPNSSEASHFVRETARARGLNYLPPITAPVKSDGLHHTVEGSLAFRDLVASSCHRSQTEKDQA